MDNEFLKLVNSYLMKSKDVTRFSGIYQNKPESLSDHENDVMKLSYIIARRLVSIYDVKVDIGLLLQRCLVHDCDETYTSDITRLTKYANQSIYNELSKLASAAAKRISESIDSTDYTYDLWKDAKDKSIEGVILKVADMLSVCNKVIFEVDYCHNLSFLRVAKEITYYINDLIDYLDRMYINVDSKNYLIKICSDSKDHMKELISTNSKFVYNYDIMNSVVISEVESTERVK